MTALRRTTPPAPPRTVLLALVMGLATLGLYLSTLTADHSFDAIFFAMSAEAAVAKGGAFLELFHPQHVLHQAGAALVVAALHSIGVDVGALIVLELISAVGGAALAGLVVHRVAVLTGSRELGVATGLATALAGGVWFYSTDGECNMPALAFAVAALPPILRALDGERRAGVVAGLLLALACGYNLTLGTLWIGLLGVALASGRDVLRRAVVLLAVASAALALLYVPRLVLLLREPGPFNPLSLVTFTGHSVGGGYLLREPFHPVGETAEMLRGFARGDGALAALLGVVPLGSLACGLAALVLRRADRATRILAAWFAATLVLFALWAGRNYEFTSFTLAPALLLGASAFARLVTSPRIRIAVAAGVGACALAAGAVNWASLVRPGLDAEANPYMRVAEMVATRTRESDRVVLTGIGRDRLKIYVLYFGRRAAVIPEHFFGPDITQDESMRRFENALREGCAGGGVLYALSDVVEDTAVPAPEGFPMTRVRDVVRALGPVEVARDGDDVLYRLQRCP